ncbi:MAG: helix-turn-helix domain-containing protein [Burkholderiaceae bacterium]
MKNTLAHSPRPEDAPPVEVLFLLLPHSLVLDWAGPAEALRLANQALQRAGQPPRFRLRFVGPQPQTTGSVGVQLAGLEPLPESLAAPSWVVLVGSPDETLDLDDAASRAATHWLRRLAGSFGQDGNRLITVCAGALLAGHAGLLAGRRVTTHHLELDRLAAIEPACDVLRNRVFVLDDGRDGAVLSSAGITTGVDLALHLVAQSCGDAVAARVAQTMVVALRRGPQDPELSPFLAYRNHLHPALHRVQDAVSGQPAHDWTLPAMADIACTSPRHLNRLFVEHAGIAPLQYLRRIRLAVAQAALHSGHNVTQAAALSGFSSDTQLRRAWHQFQRTGTPSGRELPAS